MLLFKVLSRILNHPLNRKNKARALLRFVKWQLGTRLIPYPIVFPFTERSKLLIERGLTGATGNLYCGLDEFYDMAFLLHFLRSEDGFVDVGANIGSYTILASGHIGCKSISIEPNARSFYLLMNNIRINNIVERVLPVNLGVGSKPGVIQFTQGHDTVNHVAAQGEKNTVEIKLDALDNILSAFAPTLLKVDVEGYEKEVFLGGQKSLKQDSLKVIIVELVNHGVRYGFSDEDVHKNLVQYGFEPCSYDPFTRALERKLGFNTQNTLYVRDFDFVASRVRNASLISMNGVKF